MNSLPFTNCKIPSMFAFLFLMNYHKFISLKQLIISQFCRSKVPGVLLGSVLSLTKLRTRVSRWLFGNPEEESVSNLWLPFLLPTRENSLLFKGTCDLIKPI